MPEKNAGRTANRLINGISIALIVAFVAVVSVLVVRYVQVRNYNRHLKEIKTQIEADYESLLDKSQKLKDETYYTIYFEDQYMVIDDDKIVVEFK